jgi:hypothetical protein
MDSFWMMWHDDTNAPTADRIARAATYFEKKHGHKPTRCRLPKGEKATGVTGVTCSEDQYVLPGHLMLQ